MFLPKYDKLHLSILPNNFISRTPYQWNTPNIPVFSLISLLFGDNYRLTLSWNQYLRVPVCISFTCAHSALTFYETILEYHTLGIDIDKDTEHCIITKIPHVALLYSLTQFSSNSPFPLKFVIPWMLFKWYHAVCNLLGKAFFTQPNFLRIPWWLYQ